MSDTVDVRVTVIGTPRPIIHPPTGQALQALVKCSRALDAIGPSLADAMLALARTGGRP